MSCDFIVIQTWGIFIIDSIWAESNKHIVPGEMDQLEKFLLDGAWTKHLDDNY